jgi:hypothetical protein
LWLLKKTHFNSYTRFHQNQQVLDEQNNNITLDDNQEEMEDDNNNPMYMLELELELVVQFERNREQTNGRKISDEIVDLWMAEKRTCKILQC